jgi:DNA transformation protein
VDHDFIRDLFAPFGPVTVRRMFSGAGISANGLMFGLVVRDVIYLKADHANRADFER